MAPRLSPSSVVLLSGLSPHARALFFSQNAISQAVKEGGIIMTDLRALVGACFLLAVMGFVVSVPLGWGLFLIAASVHVNGF